VENRETTDRGEVAAVQVEPVPVGGTQEATVGGVVAPPVEDRSELREEPAIPLEIQDVVADGTRRRVPPKVGIVGVEGDLSVVKAGEKPLEGNGLGDRSGSFQNKGAEKRHPCFPSVRMGRGHLARHPITFPSRAVKPSRALSSGKQRGGVASPPADFLLE
jgi:hypothetical protein